MVSFGLPSVKHRSWTGKFMRLDTIYSVAGVSTSMFLTTPDGTFIVDIGDGALRDMLEVARTIFGEISNVGESDIGPISEWLRGVFITHPHYDHYSGLMALLYFLNTVGRKEPLPIFYPEGSDPIESLTDHYTEHLFEDSQFDPDLFPLKYNDRIRIDNTEVVSLSSVHRHSRPGKVGGPVKACHYQFTYGGEKVVFSGDTGDISNLEKICRGADLAVVEATYPEGNEISDGVHLTVEQARKATSGAMDVLLIHFTGESFKKAAEMGFRV
jgi:ribonuclease BN (tRNA processing enzyme)